jgi:hypothetical protein
MGSVNTNLIRHRLLMALDDRGKLSCHKVHTTLRYTRMIIFFGFDFEFCTDSLLVMIKYEGFLKTIFDWAIMGGGRIVIKNHI